MSEEAKDYSSQFAKVLSSVRDLGIAMEDGGNLDPTKMRHLLIPKARCELAKAMAAKGMTQREIAEELGVSKSQINRDLTVPDGTENVPDGTAVARAAAEERRKAELAKLVDAGLEWGLHVGDFRKLAHCIEDNSVQLVFTDPPYDKESIELYRDAAAIAARILKPNGSFIAYSGQRHLPAVLSACSQYLNYWWTIAGVHGGGNQILNKLGIRCGWKPLVWFVKETRGDVQNVLADVVSGDREKDIHEWQQSEDEAAYYIDKLTTPDGTVVDFFAGAGTTIAAAQKLGRNWIAFEIDENSASRALQRLQQEAAE